MEKLFKDISPIMDIEHDCIVSKKGDISVVFRVLLPEAFTLFDEDYENMHQAFIKGLKVLPKGCIFHKQDWYTTASYKMDTGAASSFLVKHAARHFDGRQYLEHESYIILTKKPEGRRAVTSLYSGLLRKSPVPPEVLQPEALKSMQDSAGQFQIVLKGAGIRLERLSGSEIASSPKKIGLIERYYSLSTNPHDLVIKDVELKPDLRVGNDYCQLYTLADTAHLPSMCGSRITYEKYSTDHTRFPIGFSSSIGLLLNCNHIYNQFLFLDDPRAVAQKMEKKKLRLQSLSSYSRENAIARDAVNDFLNELVGEQRLPVKAHFNLLVWGENPAYLQECKNLVTAGLAQMEATVKLETSGAGQIWWAGIPGNAAEMPVNETWDTFAEQACTFLALETNYRSAPPWTGIRFCDRLNARPVQVDLFDQPRKEGTCTNMGTLVVGASGGGKSVTVNHILNSMCEQGDHCFVIDIGGSYRGLCEIQRGYYFTYEESNPIRFNPFYLSEGERLDTEKKENLKALLVGLWKQEDEQFSRAEYVALSNALEGYYAHLLKHHNIFPCFDSFYVYLETIYVEVLKAQRVKDKDFDVDNFLYVLKPFYNGGEFDYLLNARQNLDLLNNRFTVVELDNLRDHPILFGVVTMICISAFMSKMRKLGATRKVLVVDEAWKALARNGMASFIQYAYKTFRKFNAVPVVATQEIDDLISSPIVKDTIVANSDIKIMTDMRKFMNRFDKIQDTLGLSEKSKSILLSVNKDDREIFIELGGKVSKVYRNELSRHEYYAFTTEGKERVRVREMAEQCGSLEGGIEELVRLESIGG